MDANPPFSRCDVETETEQGVDGHVIAAPDPKLTYGQPCNETAFLFDAGFLGCDLNEYVPTNGRHL
jgi:hypothetical protein